MTDSNKKNADGQDDLVEHTFDITIPVAGIAAAVTALALFAFIIYQLARNTPSERSVGRG